MAKIRLNKFLVESGYCSRRQADKLIAAGLVMVNGQRAPLGIKIDEADQIKIKGELLQGTPPKVYLLFHKPAGLVTTAARHQGEQNVIDFINYPERIFSVGRLDKNSTGLLLLTNDGALAYQITHPKFGHEKEYLVQVNKPLTADCCHKLANGIKLEEGKTAPAQVKQHSNREFEIILTEGKKRQIRRMCEALGYKVTKLKRTRLLTLKLGALPVGSWRSLSKTELKSIKQSLEEAS